MFCCLCIYIQIYATHFVSGIDNSKADAELTSLFVRITKTLSVNKSIKNAFQKGKMHTQTYK